MGHRMSSLPVVQYCGQAGKLNERYGSGRAAVMSTYFHALCAGSIHTPQLKAKLTAEELEEVADWHKPGTIELYDGEVVLDYASADKELEVMLTDDGEHTYSTDKAISIGHLDFAWGRKFRGQLVAFVADIKKSEWTIASPNSLQLAAYGWAYASLIGADAYVPGVWAATEGKYIWGDWVDLQDPDSLDVWLQIKHAALNNGEFATGPHCRNCFARLHCPEFLFPPNVDKLATFSEGHEPTPEELADAYLAAQAMEDIAKRLKDNVKEYGRRGVEIRAADGRRLTYSQRNGKESADVKALKVDYPELADKYIKRGEPFLFPSWSKS